ncbi:MAG: cbb3-type cytochrome c oxidase subunit II [Verrucomicrobiota bacterium]|nr:cbb3-type cytochrome c oxidase subunit II [Verrucomicrobiota bacterium]
MTIGLSFIMGAVAGSVAYFMLGLWWPVALVVGIVAWLAFGLFGLKMDSTFTLMSGAILVFCVSLSMMIMRSSEQLSSLQYADTVDEAGTEFRYPVPLLGKAPYGENVYRSNGCAACHTQQVSHEGVEFDIKALATEKNHSAVKEAVNRFYRVTGQPASSGVALGLPIGEWETIALGASVSDAAKARGFLSAAGASVDVQVRFHGEDLEKDEFSNPKGRGWGKRRSVARDYLFVERPMLGSVRIGPDLANVGARLSRSTLMRILLNPKSVRQNSKMPEHSYLFELVEEGEGEGLIAVREGEREIYYKPTKDAEALVDYLLSLKSANYPLEEAPVYQPFTSSLPKPATPDKEAEKVTDDEGIDSSK